MQNRKVVDTGLDESSCFFAHDEAGDHVTHGYYFDEWGINFPITYYAGVSNDDGADDDNSGRPRPNSQRSSSRGGFTQYGTDISEVFNGGDFTAYPDRRKVFFLFHHRPAVHESMRRERRLFSFHPPLADPSLLSPNTACDGYVCISKRVYTHTYIYICLVWYV